MENGQKPTAQIGIALEVAVFLCGALVMIFEINGSRMLAPFLGTSTYIWTSLIGVILAALSIGYWVGGRMADARPSVAVLASAVFTAGGLVSLTVLIKDVFLGIISVAGIALEMKALFAAIVLFAPASVLFGFVLPYAVKLRMQSLSSTGRTVGRLYALSTIGSIAGTFAAGFFLIPFFGSVRTLYLIAGILFAVSFLLAPFALKRLNIAAIAVFIAAVASSELLALYKWQAARIREIDTEYSRLTIFESTDPDTGKPIQALSNDPYFVQSAVFLDSDELVFDYNKFFHLAGILKRKLRHSLMIGGAGYTFPRDYLKTYPESRIDVVEIDPRMTKIAHEYFMLEDDPRMSIFHQDARVYLNNYYGQKYDAVFMDAFGTLFSVPYQLTTVEAMRAIDRILVDDGILLMNLGSALKGRASMFLRAELATLRSVFPEVKVFKVKPERQDTELQNIVIIALKRSRHIAPASVPPLLSELLQQEYYSPIELNLPVLTDEFAPVEHYNSVALRSLRVTKY